MNKLLRAKRSLIKRNVENDQGLHVILETKAELVVLEDSILDDDTPSDDATLVEIQRKQYFDGALKVVNDNTFQFSQLLDQRIQALETKENCNAHGSKLYHYISER